MRSRVERGAGILHIDLRKVENTGWEPLLTSVSRAMAEASTSLVVIHAPSAHENSYLTKLVESLSRMAKTQAVRVHVFYSNRASSRRSIPPTFHTPER
jgi:hypothetical protein